MYHPHTSTDRSRMLEAVGAGSIEDLFEDVPARLRFPDLDLPPALTEVEMLPHLHEMADRNRIPGDLACFLGAGAYDHHVPAAVDALIQRGEFLTAYTPYQPEISQGTLQAIFEFQSMIAALTGMDVSNASHYDGATAVAEAVNMSFHTHRSQRSKVVLSAALNPQMRETVRTYLADTPVHLAGDGLGSDPANGPDVLLPLIDSDTALVVVQYPDFFGRIYDYSHLAEAAHSAGALLSVHVNPTALGLLKPPGEFGADIVTGEGQPLGIPLSFGGPYLGLFATLDEHVRKMPGRLAGETVDSRGQRGYVLTLSTREQHIRRERATSNICTNQGLMTLAATIYLSILGKHGLREVARLCYDKAHYAASQIAGLPGFSLWSRQPFFHEFAVNCPRPAAEVNRSLLASGILGGYELGRDYPELEKVMLLAVTEKNTKAQIDNLVAALKDAGND
ncbi:MAG TPA: aminomethyl-transferring glycine dehydrogenase subunit GcvPA [Anaerolineales bacterium]|nr:aminomethyl-transferring glycine dehydrogenase subunit GcvPA [Anaerolineales bacterium]